MDGDRLAALLADAVASEAARDRAKERMLRQAAEEEATFVGTLVELGESGERVAIHLDGDRVHRGVVVAVARDFVVLRTETDRSAVVAVRSITSLRSTRLTRRDTAGARGAAVDVSLAAFLASLAPERMRVQIGVTGARTAIVGVLRSVGADVLTADLEGGEAPRVVVPLHAVADVVLLED